jgi:hypothetical protein
LAFSITPLTLEMDMPIRWSKTAPGENHGKNFSHAIN